MEPTPLLDCGLGPGWHGAATRSLHRARAASCPLATLATQWRATNTVTTQRGDHTHCDHTVIIWEYGNSFKNIKWLVLMCCRPVASVLRRRVCCRGRYWPGHKTVAPPRPGTAAPPSPGRHPGHHSHNYNLQHWLGLQIVATLTFRLIVYVSSFNADTTPCTNPGIYKIMLRCSSPCLASCLLF